ncbi:basic proline-rich protein-like isoform X2 [Pezoporus flaviventris]|uniref:basic proline-rich protein-like isoform X2 n=1 Tax=Pezoporus flaviventris TaxID=889875 RepID=UPI002AB2BB03|nr:basic proline-rich protein-like isoform X2 [Pezoporus flaviventris]
MGPSPPGAAMAAGCGPAPPWTYRRIAREYAYLEKRFVAELAPPWPPRSPPSPAGLRLPPPPACETRPRAPPTRCHPEGSRGWPPPCAPRAPGPGARPGPPSYEAHMQRMQAAHARRGGPPPYVSPPRLRRSPPHPAAPGPPGPAQPRPGPAEPRGCAGWLEPHSAPGGHRGPAPASPRDAAIPGGPRQPPAQPNAAAGCREPGPGPGGRQRAAGGRGATSSSTPPVWWSGPSTCPPCSGSRSGTWGGPRGPSRPRQPPRCPRGCHPPGRPLAAPGAPPEPLAQPRGVRGPSGPVPAAAAGAVRAGSARGCVPHPPAHGPRLRLRGRGGPGGVPVAALPGPPHLQQQQQQPGEHRGPPGTASPPWA